MHIISKCPTIWFLVSTLATLQTQMNFPPFFNYGHSLLIRPSLPQLHHLYLILVVNKAVSWPSSLFPSLSPSFTTLAILRQSLAYRLLAFLAMMAAMTLMGRASFTMTTDGLRITHLLLDDHSGWPAGCLPPWLWLRLACGLLASSVMAAAGTLMTRLLSDGGGRHTNLASLD